MSISQTGTSSVTKSNRGETSSIPGYLFVLPWQLSIFGGVNSVVKGLYESMYKQDRMTPHILLNLWEPDSIDPCPGFDLLAMRLRDPSGKRPWRDAAAFLLSLPGQLIGLRRSMRQRNIQCINPHYPGLYCLTFVVLRTVLRFQFIVSIHGSELVAMMQSRGILRWLNRTLLLQADYLVVCSYALGNRLSLFVPEASSRIRVVWNGINISSLRELAANSTQQPPAEPYVLMVGSFDLLGGDNSSAIPRFRKGQDVLLDAWARVRNAHPQAKLVFCGTGGYVAWVRERAAQFPEVLILENQSNAAVSRLMSQASVLTLPSRGEESFGIVLIEAGCHGTPVIASAIDGMPEVIRDGIDGFIVPPEDPEALASAIDRMLREPELNRRLGESFRRRVEAEFTWEQAAHLYQNLEQAPGLTANPGRK